MRLKLLLAHRRDLAGNSRVTLALFQLLANVQKRTQAQRKLCKTPQLNHRLNFKEG